jgi:hypothetical protein
MSSSSRNTSSASGRAFCKVCRDAGRPESEYTNHFVKDQPGPNGKVVCPMLLNQACRICHNTGHTSSYCSQYRSRREEPRRDYRREERYIEREEPSRDYRREERYIEREEPSRDYRREERYIEREREPRRDISFNHLRDDTERREREIRDRDESYQREQDRRAKPWLQAALKPASAARYAAPYAHPHGPRVRLNLESNALCASKHAVISSPEENQENSRLAIEAVRNVVVKLNHAANWGDEDAEKPFVCDPEQMFREFEAEFRTSSEEHNFIEECDDQSEMPFACGY